MKDIKNLVKSLGYVLTHPLDAIKAVSYECQFVQVIQESYLRDSGILYLCGNYENFARIIQECCPGYLKRHHTEKECVRYYGREFVDRKSHGLSVRRNRPYKKD